MEEEEEKEYEIWDSEGRETYYYGTSCRACEHAEEWATDEYGVVHSERVQVYMRPDGSERAADLVYTIPEGKGKNDMSYTAVTADELLDYIEIYRQLEVALAGEPVLSVLGAAMNMQHRHNYGDCFVSVTIRRDVLGERWEVVLDAWSFHAGPGDVVEKHELFGRACGAVTSAQAVVDRVPFDSSELAVRQAALTNYVTAANLETSLKDAQLAEYVIEGLRTRADRERDDARRLPSPEGASKKRFASTHVPVSDRRKKILLPPKDPGWKADA